MTWGSSPGRGPLAGLKVLEFGAIGPSPFAAMVMADMGADVVRVDRADVARGPKAEAPHMARGRRSIAVDLKCAEGVQVALEAADRADVLIEGFRPGVMERLGLGPDVCIPRNPALVYGRMTGWGQLGPAARDAGHDINYISIAGVLGAMGPAGAPPTVPLNLVGDFGGGGMLLLAGVLMALFERASSGRGQVVDAAMVDGASLLMTLIHEFRAEGRWLAARGDNLLDGGAPFYDTYETADGRYMAVGALEPQFFAELVGVLGIEFDLAHQDDPAAWPGLREQLRDAFKRRTRAEWERIFDGTDACVSPVLTLDEASSSRYAAERDAFVDVDGRTEPAPAPRFSRTPAAVERGSSVAGADTEDVLRDWDVDQTAIERLISAGAVVQRRV
jgi:alpha-methylacyl-CoA racemase